MWAGVILKKMHLSQIKRCLMTKKNVKIVNCGLGSIITRDVGPDHEDVSKNCIFLTKTQVNHNPLLY